MAEPIRARMVEVNFSPEDGDGVLVTLRVWDKSHTYRAGCYLLVEADEQSAPERIPVNSPFERVPVCACDPGTGEPPTKLQQLKCRARGGPCADNPSPEEQSTIETPDIEPTPTPRGRESHDDKAC